MTVYLYRNPDTGQIIMFDRPLDVNPYGAEFVGQTTFDVPATGDDLEQVGLTD